MQKASACQWLSRFCSLTSSVFMQASRSVSVIAIQEFGSTFVSNPGCQQVFRQETSLFKQCLMAHRHELDQRCRLELKASRFHLDVPWPYHSSFRPVATLTTGNGFSWSLTIKTLCQWNQVLVPAAHRVFPHPLLWRPPPKRRSKREKKRKNWRILPVFNLRQSLG